MSVSGASPQNAIARRTSSAASDGRVRSLASTRSGSHTVAAIDQRARKVAVSSQRVSSQPATFGGANSSCPALPHIHAQADVSMPRPTARSIPARWTTGGLTIRRLGS